MEYPRLPRRSPISRTRAITSSIVRQVRVKIRDGKAELFQKAERLIVAGELLARHLLNVEHIDGSPRDAVIFGFFLAQGTGARRCADS